MPETVKRRVFKGDRTILWLLLCCVGVIPGLIYYWIKCEEITSTSRATTKRKKK